MDWAWIMAASGFAFAMAGTPGPNNTMVTASGANYGFRRTLPVAIGMSIGVAVIIKRCGSISAPASGRRARTAGSR